MFFAVTLLLGFLSVPSLCRHVALLSVKGTDFKIEPIKLKTVRPFLLDTVTLADSGVSPHETESVLKYLEDKVQDLIDRGTAELAREPQNPTPPLVRMKVDYSGGYEPLNIPRFGRKFSSQVANPNNILMFFHRRIETTSKEPRQKGTSTNTVDSLSKTKDNVNIQMFLYDLLKGSNLKLLSAKNLMESVKEFVEKGEKEAIEEVVTCSVTAVQGTLKEKPLDELSEDIAAEIERSREELQVRQEEEGERTIQRLAENRRLNPQKQVSGKDNDSSDDGLEEYDMDVAPSTSGRGSGRGKGKKRGSSTNQSSSTGRGSRGGRGRGRGRGSKSTSSASTNRQSTPNQLSFVSSTASSSSSVMREVVKSRTIKRSAINYVSAHTVS
jgi:double-strand break repair protein MRE11